ncbi:outer membrane protein, multidrug efflux system [Desulfonauticus submarinus]|uniref:Outer membrane protein, multidrug efflux system n=1 Tax=Desulfonauticus submarinus TaxID=206665 RepID=A0A1G9ZMU2_9BACT|nr:efflux transporter outer membrane subunit [Desulfonauticus submarinus]SDN22301.1 outer membrane protein, multidrug efflux system [Desulfonauticus submarinus]
MKKEFIIILFIFTMLSSCSFKPKYVRPNAPIPKELPTDGVYSNISYENIDIPNKLKWEDFFIDSKLKNIIKIALENNRDLRLAILNVEKARQIYGIKRADLYPSIYATANSSRKRISDDLSPLGKGYIQSEYSVNLGLAEWEIDFFGRIRSLKEEALEHFFAAKENRRSAQISLITEVARVYFILASDIEHYKIANKLYKIAEHNFKLIDSQYKAGIASDIDLNRAKSVLNEIKINIITYEQQIEKDKNALNLLVGNKVSKDLLPSGLQSNFPMKDFSPGLSSLVLLNRPDILALEHKLKAAYANIGAARAALFPRISLLAGIGTASNELSGLFGSGSYVWKISGNAALPVFDARVWTAYKLSKLQRKLYLIQYERTIQNAFKEVLDTLVIRSTIDKQIASQKNVIQSLQHIYNLAYNRYRQGIDSYFFVLTAHKNLLYAKQKLIRLKLAKYINHVMMYSAFGGGGDFNEENDKNILSEK